MATATASAWKKIGVGLGARLASSSTQKRAGLGAREHAKEGGAARAYYSYSVTK